MNKYLHTKSAKNDLDITTFYKDYVDKKPDLDAEEAKKNARSLKNIMRKRLQQQMEKEKERLADPNGKRVKQKSHRERMKEMSDQYAVFHPKDLITPTEPYMNSILYNETPQMT